jgi:hypothetical protein
MAEHRVDASGSVPGGSGSGDLQTETHFGKMNRKQLGVLIVLVVVLGGIGLVLRRNQDASWKEGNIDMGNKLLSDLPVNDIARISIARGTNRLELVKKEDVWRVQERQDYPANYSQIRDFILKARGLKAVQREKVGPSQLSALQLVPGQGTNAAIVVDFKDQNARPVRTLLIGKQHLKPASRPSDTGEGEMGWPDGRYVSTGGSMVAVVADPLDNVEPRPEVWLNKDFIRVEKAKSIEVDFPSSTNSWKLTRETESGEWKLADSRSGEQLDASKAASVSYPLNSLSFVDVAQGTVPQAAGTSLPVVAKVDTFDQFHYTITVNSKTNEDYLVTLAVAAEIPKERPKAKDEKEADKSRLDKEFKESSQKLEDKLKQEQGYENWTYFVSGWTLDPLLKERSQLMIDKKAEPATEEKVSETTPVGTP